MARALGRGFSSETRIDFGNMFWLRASFRLRAFVGTFGKAFPMPECSRWKRSGTAVREAGKKAEGM